MILLMKVSDDGDADEHRPRRLTPLLPLKLLIFLLRARHR